METPKEKYSAILLPGLVLTAAMALLHIFIPVIRDDLYFTTLSEQGYSMFTWLADRYSTWSSRIIIESVYWITGQHFAIWKAANVLVLFLLYFIAVKIITVIHGANNSATAWVCMFCVFLFPLWHMSTAGYMSSSVNYLWPVAFALTAGYGTIKSLQGHKIKAWEYPLYIFALLYACNQEQMNIILLGVFTVLSVYCITKRSFNYFLLFLLIITTAMLVFILCSPGNDIRMQQEIHFWNPAFHDVSTWEKIQYGLSATFSHCLMTPNLVILLFNISLFTAAYIKYKQMRFRAVAALPVCCYLLLLGISVFTNYDENPVAWITSVMSINNNVNILSAKSRMDFFAYTSWVMFVIYGFSVLCSIYIALGRACDKMPLKAFVKSSEKADICCILLILAVATRVILGFSPTLYASGYRTFAFLYSAFICCIALLYKEIINNTNSEKLKKASFVTIGVFACISYIINASWLYLNILGYYID